MDTLNSGQEKTKYVLLDLIGAGGMAEVYRCKLSGHQGFEKLIVLKKLHSQVAKDPEIVANFIDEARLAALLQHENIATIYDFGEMDGSYFIAMEYLFGKDLHAIMARAKELGSSLGAEVALLVVSKICQAMGYAHTLKDLQQRPLNIIHRDLTPHNVFITYEGKVKIIDFGIAKAELFDNRTKAGVVKGKVSYMSPEQLTGEDIDRRSDIFSIGILLYEMLSGRRMYTGDTATLIRKCMEVEYDPLEKVLSGLHPGIYRVLDRALVKEREARYQSCEEMRDDVDDCLFAITKRPDSEKLKTFARRLFRDEFETEKIDLFAQTKAWTGFDGTAGNELTRVEHRPTADHNIVDPTAVLRRKSLGGASRWTQILVGTIFSIGLFCLLYWGLEQPDSQVPANLLQAVPKKNHTDGEAAVTQERVETRESLHGELYGILIDARKAMEDQRFTVPEHDSAYGYFKRILAIDPEHREAREGIRLIGERYADFADQALSVDNFSEALAHIDRGLSVSPLSGRLLSLKDREKANRQQHIAALSEKARRSLSKNSLTTPAGNCAYDYYRAILRLDTGNRDALNGMQMIGDRYALLAENAFRDMNVEKSKSFVQKGLRVVPGHTHLLQLQKDLSKSKPEVFLKSLEKKLGTLFNGSSR